MALLVYAVIVSHTWTDEQGLRKLHNGVSGLWDVLGADERAHTEGDEFIAYWLINWTEYASIVHCDGLFFRKIPADSGRKEKSMG